MLAASGVGETNRSRRHRTRSLQTVKLSSAENARKQQRAVQLSLFSVVAALVLISTGCAVDGEAQQSAPTPEPTNVPVECPAEPTTPTGSPSSAPASVSSMDMCTWKIPQPAMLDGGDLISSETIEDPQLIGRYWEAFQGLPNAMLSARCPAQIRQTGFDRIDLYFKSANATEMLVQWFPKPWCNRNATVNGRWVASPDPELPVPQVGGE